MSSHRSLSGRSVVGSHSVPSVRRWADSYDFFKSHRTNGLHAK